MQDKKSQYICYLMVGLVIAFLLVWNITYTDALGEYPEILSSIQHESEDIKSIPPLRLGFGLAGTIIVGSKNSYAVIVDETTGVLN